MTSDPDPDPRYVAARRVLLDALDALAPHRPAVIVAGAQAVYLQTGQGGGGIAPYTTDGDLALDPTLLGDDPRLETVMRDAGFTLHEPQSGSTRSEPGIWTATVSVDGHELLVPVDLIVPEAIAPPGGRRGARLGAHGNQAARRARGLEAALVDHTTMTIRALEPGDRRAFEVKVAGPSALLVAKAHKIRDRLDAPRDDRLIDKDASDVYRLMQTTSPGEVGARLAHLQGDPVAADVTREAIGHLDELFGHRTGAGVRMAVRALRLAISAQEVSTFATTYTRRMVAAANEGTPASTA